MSVRLPLPAATPHLTGNCELTVPPHSADLALALRLADAADAISTPPFRSADLLVEIKGDGSPVTVVDRAVETMMQKIVLQERPQDSFLGEEIGPHGSGPRRWIFDGIDGTHNYAAGVAAWATMIALEIDGEVQLGVVSSPCGGVRWYAERGAGSWRLEAAHHDGVVTSFHDSVPTRLMCTNTEVFDDANVLPVPPEGFMLGWRSTLAGELLRGTASNSRTYAYYGAAVAEGLLDATIILNGGPWDFAANTVIVEEAGGEYRDPWGGRRLDTNCIVFTNGKLTQHILAIARPLLPATPDVGHRNPDWRTPPGTFTP